MWCVSPVLTTSIPPRSNIMLQNATAIPQCHLIVGSQDAVHCHRSYTGHSFGTKHSKIIYFINAVILMNKCCKHFSSEWPNKAFSVPQSLTLLFIALP